jgi:hypothetical protein
VTAVRRLIAQRHLATLLLAATLMLKLLVPTGYMIGSDHGRPMIELCSGVLVQSAAMAMPEMHSGAADHGKPRDHGKPEMPCAFSSLSAASIAFSDPLILATLIAFVMAISLSIAVRPPSGRRGYIRPPLRGPPIAL